jgi:hypothetical protein
VIHVEHNTDTERKPEGSQQMIFDVITRIATNVTASNVPKLEARLAGAEAELFNPRAVCCSFAFTTKFQNCALFASAYAAAENGSYLKQS